MHLKSILNQQTKMYAESPEKLVLLFCRKMIIIFHLLYQIIFEMCPFRGPYMKSSCTSEYTDIVHVLVKYITLRLERKHISRVETRSLALKTAFQLI